MDDNELPNREKSDDEPDEKKKVKAFGLRHIVKTSTGIIAHCTIFEKKNEQPKRK